MIEVQELCRDFGGFVAVDKISFALPKGQILGFLGPNGAGKSTTMKMLTCFLEPTAGTAKIGGKDIIDDSIAVREQIGYLPESAPLYAEMTVAEFLHFVAEMRGKRGDAKAVAAERMREVCFLSEVWHQTIDTLSKGYRQRVGFAQALIHDPPVLILDEPTDGLDPNQKHEMRQLIRQMGQDKTIILSTHILEEVEAVCERVVIIANGKLVADSTPQDLMSQSRFHNAVTVRLDEADLQQAKKVISSSDWSSEVEELPSGLRVFAKDRRPIIDQVSSVAKEQNWGLRELHVEQGRLDEVFRRVTLGEEGRQQ